MGNLKSEGLTAAELKMISEFVEALEKNAGNESSYDGQVRLSEIKDKYLHFQYVNTEMGENKGRECSHSTRYIIRVPLIVITDSQTSMKDKIQFSGEWKAIDHEKREWMTAVGNKGEPRFKTATECWSEPTGEVAE